LHEDVPVVVEEFYPEAPAKGPETTTTAKDAAVFLSSRLQDKVARMGAG